MHWDATFGLQKCFRRFLGTSHSWSIVVLKLDNSFGFVRGSKFSGSNIGTGRVKFKSLPLSVGGAVDQATHHPLRFTWRSDIRVSPRIRDSLAADGRGGAISQ